MTRRRSTLNDISRTAYRTGRITRDVRAVQTGRIGPRLANKALGRLFGRLWR